MVVVVAGMAVAVVNVVVYDAAAAVVVGVCGIVRVGVWCVVVAVVRVATVSAGVVAVPGGMETTTILAAMVSLKRIICCPT